MATPGKHPGNPHTNLLAVTLKHHAGSLSIDLDFVLTQPWTILFGPSGSGKTTILRTIAGFVPPDAGEIVYGPTQRTLVSTTQGLFVPPHRRPVRTAGQTARLFPQLTVKDNVLYGMNRASAHNESSHDTLTEIMTMMRLHLLANGLPGALSGGERQRVSVARAVASAISFDGSEKPLLLLDEPFAGLDTVLRDELALALRAALSRWKIPVLSVSHDIAECHLLDAEILRIADGKLLDQGPATLVLAHERQRLLARLGYTS